MLRKKNQTTTDSKTIRRIKALPTEELIPWAESCLYAAGRSLSEYRKSADEAFVADAELAADTLNEIIAELRRRIVADAVVPSVLRQ